MQNYYDIAFTPAVRTLQERKGSSGIYDAAADAPVPEVLESAEVEYLSGRDSFYLATVNENGWPYLQHRGGEPGFVKVLGPTTIGWIERRGNRQYLGTGNIMADDRVALIFVDYPNRTRLKLFGHATYHSDPAPEMVEALDGEAVRGDGAITVEIAAASWNCPKYITPRYTAQEVQAVTDELQARISDLESRLAAHESPTSSATGSDSS